MARLRHPALCWLLAVVVLVQSVWVAFHLASEPHLVPGLPGDATSPQFAVVALPDDLPACIGDDRVGSDHTPHCALDHKAPKDKRGDELPPDAPTVGVPPAVRTTATPPRCVRTAVDRAPPRAMAVAVVAAAPRAPPRG